MQKIRKEIIVKNKSGLHARPAALFVQAANKFDSRITVEKDSERVNGKSIMGILTLGAERDSRIIIEAEGRDARDAIFELERLVSNNEQEGESDGKA
ncbi:HPr family phosphocarrier protein [Candidatus Omnitrophota bacterium]